MTLGNRHAARIIAAALIVTVITQVVYMMVGAGGQSHLAYPIWRTEALMALVVAVLGFALVSRNALVGGCLAVGGIFNLIQTGMGLTMFYQLGYGGDTPPNPVFVPVLGMSFYLYFAAKAAFGLAALALGIQLWRSAVRSAKIIGLLAAVTGLAALGLNAAAMMFGMGLVFFAGAAGTAATLLLAAALVMAMTEGETSA
ncbi:hypothetical protein GCM10009127_11290 [Alteraurantiacibacter aestuarii]|uniref:Thiamine biosynthesis protein ThiC n=1 Tax=Alteraurantiacibacter aestuarii TaxID=650004 RepID=A0A844ZKW4_9SPHN|nr:hypothetical protein [Alteraurantiacibacter aestuarii]MXO87517.1 hypothetical protein [Alteraurantiacibacter aestuarii]